MKYRFLKEIPILGQTKSRYFNSERCDIKIALKEMSICHWE